MKYFIKNKNWHITKYNMDKVLYILIDRPNHINSYDEFIWINKKGGHYRDYDLPAAVSNDGLVVWYKNNKYLTHIIV